MSASCNFSKKSSGSCSSKVVWMCAAFATPHSAWPAVFHHIVIRWMSENVVRRIREAVRQSVLHEIESVPQIEPW